MARYSNSDDTTRIRLTTGWVSRLRDRVFPTYVDGADLPDDPPSPYRARLQVSTDTGTDGVEVSEREVVRGTVRVIYEIRCNCRRRWFRREFERVHVCPRCGRAVLVERPD
jgi:hypothetical protein